MIEHQFPADLFLDPARASRNLQTTHETFIRSGSQYAVDEFSRALHGQLSVTPDPDMALNNLVRFTETSVSKASLFNDLLHYPVVLEVLLKLFGHSQYFADILVREPGLFRWLTSSDSLMTPVTEKYLHAEVERILQTFTRAERRLDALKRLHRRELLRIGARDILGTADLAETTSQLSHLADALIDAAYRIAIQQMAEKYPPVPSLRFAIIGLGKLGGVELNYSSDIDIIFVYGDDEESEAGETGGKTLTRHELFIKLAERVVLNLSESTPEGYLYRVDVRLRPESGAGPLARSLRSHLLYYESRGELWERQMLIKARPVGGDPGLGEEFISQLQPFVYPRTLFHHPAESVARIKARIEAAVGGEANIKLMAGGIRDIEFIAQTLQLVNGGKNRALRMRNTLQALDALSAETFLSTEECAALKQAYTFYRTLEHRLQTMLNTQTHTVPEDPKTVRSLARRVGLVTADELRNVWKTHLQAVRKIFEQVLLVQADPGELGILAIIEGGLPDDVIGTILKASGFRDIRGAAKNLRLLTTGSVSLDAQGVDTRAREAFRSMAPALFKELGGTPNPDLTLNGLTTLASAQKFPHQMYRALAEPRFRRFILDICAISPRFSRSLASNPLLFESLAAEVESLASGPVFSLPSTGDLLQFKQYHELRTGIRRILGFTDFDQMSAELSQVADFILTAVFAEESRKLRLKSPPFAVFALGKYGTREINFDADLDLMFIVGESDRSTKERLEGLASKFLNRLTQVTEKGQLFQVDPRLRPEGKNAPLVITRDAYTRYLHERSSLWERQSLTRLRFICGDATLGRVVSQSVEAFVYDTPLPAKWVETIVEMRRKTEPRIRTRGAAPVDIKLGAGGIRDVEFLMQMALLKHGSTRKDIRTKRILDLLALHDLPEITRREEEVLAGAYRMYRELAMFMRITLDERASILPEGEKLESLARVVDGSKGDEFSARVVSTMAEVRKAFLEISNRYLIS